MKLIYGFAAGDAGDTLARMIADRLGSGLGAGAVVENRSGASGRIGTKAVISAAPDGLTWLLAPMGPAALHPVSYSNLDFDPFTDLAPVSHAASFDIAVAVGAQLPVKTAAELVSWLRSNPDKANYGTPGLGGLPHFFAIMFQSSAGVAMRNVPYRGGAAVMNDLVAGQLPVAFGTVATYTELHNAGRVRVLATSGKSRSSFLANVPTFIEAGFNIEGQGWYSLYAPLKTPSGTIARASQVVQDMMREPAIRTKIEAIGLIATGTTPEELSRIQQADRARWTPAIRASGFKPSD